MEKKTGTFASLIFDVLIQSCSGSGLVLSFFVSCKPMRAGHTCMHDTIIKVINSFILIRPSQIKPYHIEVHHL